MRLFFLPVCVCMLWLVHSGLAAPVVRSTSAGEIQGYSDQVVADGVTKDITKFLGIPFAEPPTGPHRFAKPVPKSRFSSVFIANDGAIGCIQRSKADTAYYSQYASNFSEDCLTMNIYVPSNFSDDSSASVLQTMVWIYGGSFTAGVASAYIPDILSVTTNTIVVTVNYRVGMFGFLQSTNYDGLFKGNQGLWDQHLAFKWVNQNIGMFYGSPSKVTIFGESAGGTAVLYQAMYPGNKGLFQRVISDSGAALTGWALKNPPNAEAYFRTVGCLTSDPLACLNTKSYEELQVPSSVRFSPVVDGDFVMESPEHILFGNNESSKAAREFYYSLDILTGVNQFDGALFGWPSFIKGVNVSDPHITRDQLKNELFRNELKTLDKKLDMNTTSLIIDLLEFEYVNWSDPDSYNTTRWAAVDFSNDIIFFSPGIRTLQAHLAHNFSSTSYFYEFCPKPSVSYTPEWIKGAVHFDEVSSLFGYSLREKPYRPFTQEEKHMSRVVMTLWSNFAKTGDPNKPLDVTKLINTTWPEYDMTSQKYLKLSNQMSANSVKSQFHAGRLHFWSDILPSILNSHSEVSPTTTTTPKPLGVDFSGIIG